MRGFALGVAGALLLCAAPSAHADEYRYGVAPSLSGGAALFTSASPLPSFVGLTGMGVEVFGEATPWGGFLRGDYLSSGGDGRWTAVTFAGGPSRRLLGDVNHFSL